MENIWIVQSKYLSHIILPVYYAINLSRQRDALISKNTPRVYVMCITQHVLLIVILYLSYIFLLCHIMYCWDYTCNAIMFQMTGVRVATNTLYTRAFYFPIKMI